MFASRFLTRTAALVAAVMLVLSGVQPAYAAPPPNDNFADATIINALPYSSIVDNSEATVEPDEPQYGNYSPWTVWYSFTPSANAVLRANMEGTIFSDTNLTVYQAEGPGFGSLNFLGSVSWSWGGSIIFSAQAGTTYYFQAGSLNNVGELHLNLEIIPPPANDDFADAAIISSLPFGDTVDITGASIEAGEPNSPCHSYALGKTIWYSFTPASSGSITANVPSLYTSVVVTAFTGNSLTSLTEILCSAWGAPLTIRAEAGTTYYFQVSILPWDPGGLVSLYVDATPPPAAGFWFDPSAPSIFDTLQFYDQSYDPGGVGFQSFAWDFGDGTTSTGSSTSHRYAKDGDYTVQYSVTTWDGRTASTSQVVQVRTHDVAIAKVSAPMSASSGQTRTITVNIRNKRYPENVEIVLFKSIPGGFQVVGSYIQFVPVRSGNRTSTFTFNYTFTKDDASIEKVTFKAVATIVNARDALPADNEAISYPPTKIGR